MCIITVWLESSSQFMTEASDKRISGVRTEANVCVTRRQGQRGAVPPACPVGIGCAWGPAALPSTWQRAAGWGGELPAAKSKVQADRAAHTLAPALPGISAVVSCPLPWAALQ